MGLATVFKHWFTGKDNESFEVGRALWALSVLVGMIYQGYDVIWKGLPFDIQAFGLGMGTLLGGGGIAIAVKDRGMGPGPKVTQINENVEGNAVSSSTGAQG